MVGSFPKDPAAITSCGLNWTDWLNGDAIASSTWIVPPELTKVQESNTATITAIKFSGGVSGHSYVLTNRITTTTAVANCLRGADFEKLQEEIWERAKAAAVNGLRGHVDSAVDGWGRAIDVSSLKGDHRASKDLLEAVGIVEREPSGARLGVQIVIG